MPGYGHHRVREVARMSRLAAVLRRLEHAHHTGPPQRTDAPGRQHAELLGLGGAGLQLLGHCLDPAYRLGHTPGGRSSTCEHGRPRIQSASRGPAPETLDPTIVSRAERDE